MNKVSPISDNKRIAKNTIYLYFRMVVIMAITLFTSREILRILGVDDFGIYNVVAGVVVLLAFLQTGLTSAFQRYLAYDIGRGDEEQVNRTFCMSVNANLCIVLIIVLLAETVGLWFVYTQLVIPEDRVSTALIVYHFSVLTFVFTILRIPYNSAIVAYEKMSFYAYISIAESVLKLGIVYLLVLSSVDKLYLYAILLTIVSAIILFLYFLYCFKHIKTCRYHYYWNTSYFRELLGFSGWSMLAGVANVSAQQGGNILLNIFSGLSANASYGVANQVSHAVYAFSQNFQVAFNPQITKLFAARSYNDLYQLVFRSSLASYYLMLIVAVPFILQIDFVLDLWLDKVPEYAGGFCILMTLYQLVDAFQAPINTLIYASGKVKIYNIWLSAMIFLNLPLSYILLRIGVTVYVVFFIRVSLNVLTAIARIWYMKSLMEFPTISYLKEVLLKASTITFLSFGLSMVICTIVDNSFLKILISGLITVMVIAMWGFSKNDRMIVWAVVKQKVFRS